MKVTGTRGLKAAEAKPWPGAHVPFAPLPHKMELNTLGRDLGAQGRIFSRWRKESQGWSWHLGCISAFSPACLFSASVWVLHLNNAHSALQHCPRSTGSHSSWVKAHQKLEGKSLLTAFLQPPPPTLLQGACVACLGEVKNMRSSLLCH